MKVTVRITDVYDVEVKAEYGDDHDALIAKAQKSVSKSTKPTSTLANILPQEDDA